MLLDLQAQISEVTKYIVLRPIFQAALLNSTNDHILCTQSFLKDTVVVPPPTVAMGYSRDAIPGNETAESACATEQRLYYMSRSSTVIFRVFLSLYHINSEHKTGHSYGSDIAIQNFRFPETRFIHYRNSVYKIEFRLQQKPRGSEYTSKHVVSFTNSSSKCVSAYKLTIYIPL